MSDDALSNLSHEERRFAPPEDLAAAANVTEATYEQADADFEGFWAEQAKRISWDTEPTEVLDWSNPPFAKWYADGTLNAAYNCLDRHVEAGHGDRVAFHFEGEPGDTRTITYADLTTQVKQAANALIELGVQTGDRVAIYLPMIPEAVVAMLACARIGAPHTVVFGGFSADALATRILDCGVEVVITADGGYRRGSSSALKPSVDAALERCPDVRHVLVIKRTEQETAMTEGRDLWWDEFVGQQSHEHECEFFPAEHPLYIMYTSGSTGKPKGILHTTGGYLVGCAYTHWATFDLKPETDIFWTAADIGWVTGHSYLVYGPLANGATSIMYEGTPDTPHKGRWWELIEKYRVTILYCAPTAIRTFMKWGSDIPEQFDLSSLRILGSVGEPINPGGLHLVSAQHRGGPYAGGRHLVADRDRDAHDLPDARGDRGQAGRGDARGPRGRGRRGQRRGAAGGERLRRLSGDHQAVAGHAADLVGRRPALRRHLLVAVPGDVLRR